MLGMCFKVRIVSAVAVIRQQVKYIKVGFAGPTCVWLPLKCLKSVKAISSALKNLPALRLMPKSPLLPKEVLYVDRAATKSYSYFLSLPAKALSY